MRPLFRLACDLDLILASASPRRREFLENLGLPFLALGPPGAEPAPTPGEKAGAYALRSARAKANACLASLERMQRARSCILAADTIISIDGRILGKPASHAEALAMLRLLDGRAHEVLTGLIVLPPNTREIGRLARSTVHFHKWPEDVLKAYAMSAEPLDKAGAYAIQGAGAFLVSRIEGQVSNIVGLPMTGLVEILLDLKIIEANS